jgi:hypothetical protein
VLPHLESNTLRRDTGPAMSEENVEISRQSYPAFNAAWSGPNPREAIRVWLERFIDPGVEWELEPTAPNARRI